MWEYSGVVWVVCEGSKEKKCGYRGQRLNMVAAIGTPSVVKRGLISRITTGKKVAK